MKVLQSIYNYILFNSYFYFKKDNRVDPLDLSIIYLSLLSIVLVMPIIILLSNLVYNGVLLGALILWIIAVYVLLWKNKLKKFKKHIESYNSLGTSRSKAYNGFVSMLPLFLGLLLVLLTIYIKFKVLN